MRSILEAAGEGVYGVDREGILTFVNPTATRILGYKAEELIGRIAHTTFTTADLTGRRIPSRIAVQRKLSFAPASPPRNQDWFWRKDGSGFPVQLSAAPMRESGKVVGAVVTFNDITDVSGPSRCWRSDSEELERSNTELQQFAYVSSHDLQEPLRTMASFAQLLERRYKGKLDASADDFIHFIVDGATRMQGLINDLLAYSRVGSRGKDFAPTDCTTVFDQAVANLQTAITESGAIVTHDPLPNVPGDGAQLVQVFQNLVGNSIKFRGFGRPGSTLPPSRGLPIGFSR